MQSVVKDFKRYGARGLALLAGLTIFALVVLGATAPTLALLNKEHLLILGVLTALVTLTSARHPIRFPGTYSSVSISEGATFLAVMMLGPSCAALLAAIDQILANHRLKLRPSLYLFNGSNHTVSIYVSGQIYYFVALQLNSLDLATGVSQAALNFALPLIAMAFAHYVLHLAIVGLMSHLAHGAKLWETVKDTFPWEPVTYLAGASVAGLINYSFSKQGALETLLILLMALPVPVVIYYTFKTYRDKLHEKEAYYEKMTSIYDSILEMLAMAIDAKDDVTHDHLQRVRLYARRIGELVGLSDLEIEALKAGALLHDIGKIGVPAYILNKPGKLTEHEFEQMKRHTIIGADMLSNIDFRYPVVPIVRHHHERWDGRGYPDGLKGEAIPITARILTLVDNYDALRSDRPYKTGMSREAALEYLEKNGGVLFDPALVTLFLSVVNELDEEAAELSPQQADRPEPKRPVMTAAAPGAGYYTEPPVDRAAAAINSIAETNQRVTALFEISRRLPSVLSLEDTVAVLSSRLAGLIPYSTCAISIFDASRSEFEIVHAVGSNADKFLKRRQAVTSGITGWVIANQRAMYNTNPVLDLGFLGTAAAACYKGVMVFPLVKGIVIGAISLYSTDIETYASHHVHLMESISEPASDAVYNALAYGQVQRAASPISDSTEKGLSTLRTHMDHERARSQRSGTPLSLLVVSLSDLNDAAVLAHHGRDKIMDRLCRLIKREVRETDIVAPHTDNAFVALLPDSGQVEVSEVRNRMCEAIYNSAELTKVRVNLGCASSPEDGGSFEELLQAALVDCSTRESAVGLAIARLGGALTSGAP